MLIWDLDRILLADYILPYKALDPGICTALSLPSRNLTAGDYRGRGCGLPDAAGCRGCY